MENRITGFSKDGNWYKGNLHCHTTDSDGCLNASEVVQLYRKNGYDFLAISDHDIFSDYRKEFDCEEFIILPAIEATAVLYKDEKRNRAERLSIHHIHGILGNEEMQKKAKKVFFLIGRNIRHGNFTAAGMEQKQHRNWRMTSKLMDALPFITIRYGPG